MNRRKFLTMLGVAPVVAKATPLMKFFPPVQTNISQYADWVSFSEMACETAIDPIVEMTALELGKRYYASFDILAAEAFASD